MKTVNILKAMFSIMILFSIVNATAQNFQLTKKKYSLARGNCPKAPDQSSSSFRSQSVLHSYTDADLIKLSNYIKKLEMQNVLADNSIAPGQTGTTGRTPAANHASYNQFTDEEIIKMANYIKILENAGWINTVAAIK